MVQEKWRTEETKHLRNMRGDGICSTRRHDTKKNGSFFLVTGEKAGIQAQALEVGRAVL